MAYAAPSIDQLFGGLPEGERIARFEAYKSALSNIHTRTLGAAAEGRVQFVPKAGSVIRETNSSLETLRDISKAVSGDQLAAVQTAIGNIEKDLNLTSPLNSGVSGITGLVPYNLDPVLSMLVPKELYFRNSIARIKATGQALEFRRITGVTNAGVGNVADSLSGNNGFFSSSTTQTQFPSGTGPSLNRPAMIQYAADKVVIPFKEFGYSDSVSLQAEFAGQGYTDLRQLSHTALIWAHMLGEEKGILKGKASALLTSANISAITAAITSAQDSTGAGLPASGTGTVAVTFSSSFGETASIAAGTITCAGTGAKVALSSAVAFPAGTLATNVYVTVGSTVFKATTQLLPTTGTTPVAALTFAVYAGTVPSTDGSYSALAYDGIINSIATGPNVYGNATSETTAGISLSLNGKLASLPGDDFQSIFMSLYQNVMGDPEAIVTTASIRRALATSLQQVNAGTGAITTGYRLNAEISDSGVVVGSLVGAIQNEATGRMVDLVTHRFMPAGTAVVLQKQLPFPDSGVGNCWEMHNVVDTMVIDWPQIGMSYDVSSYSYQTFAGRAPQWSALVTNINA